MKQEISQFQKKMNIIMNPKNKRMTRAEKEAKELVFGFYKIVGLDGFGYDCDPIGVIDNGLHKIAQLRSKECALRCVDKMMNEIGCYKDSSPLTYGARIRFLKLMETKIKKL